MKIIQNMLNNHNSKEGKYFDGFIQFLILLSLITFSISTVPNLESKTINILYSIEVWTVSIFTIEYLLRILFSDKRIKYIFSFYGLIDIIAILPFHLAMLPFDLRFIRIFRVFRILRVLKLARFTNALERLKESFRIVKYEFIVFIIGILFLIYVSSVFIWMFEYPVQPEKFSSVIHCFWWAVTTITTVGYGDMAPVTTGGKIFATIIVLLSLAIISIPSGLLASAISEVKNKESDKDN